MTNVETVRGDSADNNYPGFCMDSVTPLVKQTIHFRLSSRAALRNVLLWIVVLVLSAVSVSSQTILWQKEYREVAQIAPQRLIETKSQHYAIIGTTISGNTYGMLNYIDKSGEILWTKVFPTDSSHYKIGSYVSNKEDTITAVLLLKSRLINGYYPCAVRFNERGIEIDSFCTNAISTWIIQPGISAINYTQLSNGNYLSFGKGYLDESIWRGSYEPNYIQLYDPNLDTLWFKPYNLDTLLQSFGHRICEYRDGLLCEVGIALSRDPQDSTYHNYMVFFDSLGNRVRTIARRDTLYNISSLSAEKSGTLLAMGQGYNRNLSSYTGRIVRYDTTGMVLHKQDFGAQRSIGAVVPTPDMGYMAIGRERLPDMTVRWFIVRLDSTLQVLWTKSADSSGTVANFNHLIRTSKGTYVTAGQYPKSLLFVMEFTDDAVSRVIDKKETLQMSIQPNPAFNTIDIQWNRQEELFLEVHNELGATVLRKSVPIGELTISIDVSTLPQGLYFLIGRTIGVTECSHFLIVR